MRLACQYSVQIWERVLKTSNHSLSVIPAKPGMLPSKGNLHDYVYAEQKANFYLNTLKKLANDPSTFSRLHRDFIVYWNKSHNTDAKRAKLNKKLATGDISTWSFLEKLSVRKELDAYLRKTISYLYMRDLGLDLNQKDAKNKVDKTVESLIQTIQNYDTSSQSSDDKNALLQAYTNKKEFSQAHYWLMQRLSALKSKLDTYDNQDGYRKLVKVVAGVLVHHLVLFGDGDKKDPKKLTEVVQLGYAYGLTYPFVDDLLDSSAMLSPADKILFTNTLRNALNTQVVPPYPNFENKSDQLLAIYNELKWAFNFLKARLPADQAQLFFKRASMFFEAQALDRSRPLTQAKEYGLHQILNTVVLKSAASRLISRDLLTPSLDTEFDNRTFCFGIYNQFNDDIKDIEDDIASDSLTPYSWYLSFNSASSMGESVKSIENPFHYYWSVVYYLVYELYDNNEYIKALFFERSMNALQSVFKTRGKENFEKLCLQLLHTPNAQFNVDLYQKVSEPQHTLWFDKIISKELSTWLSNKKRQSIGFKEQYKKYRQRVNAQLPIAPHKRFSNGSLHEVANYSVGAGGKRIRAVMASVISEKQYGFTINQQRSVNQLLEYMHSASLIFDDLPSQDNAHLRRSVESTHVHFNSVAKAELGAVYLMMQAIETQASIDCHPAQATLSSLRYAANVTQAICEGQLLDIESTKYSVNQAYLEKICLFKTGLAIEAALVIPAILAQQNDIHISRLKQLAKHMGMMFQIRDDLLDLSGDEIMLGKPAGQDQMLNKVNFVSVMGEHEAIGCMLAHHKKALDLLKDMPKIQAFFSELCDFIIYRNK